MALSGLQRRGALVAAFAVAALWSAAAFSEDLPKVRFQAVEGSIGAIPLLVVQHEKLDEKHGFSGSFDFLGMSGGFQSFLVGNYDLTNDEDMIGIAAARAEGFDVHGFYPNGHLYLGIVVPGSSTAQTPADLVGKRVGHFGMDSGTTNFLKVVVQDAFGFDLTEKFDLQQAGPAALVPMLQSGEIEAMLNFEPNVSTAMVQTGGRYLLQATDAYKKQYNGFSPWIGSWAAKDEWLKANPKLAYAVRDALEEATNMIEASNYEILREPYIADALGVSSPAVLDQLIENGRTWKYFTTEWTPELVKAGQEFLERMAANKVIIEEAPADTLIVLEDFIGPRPQ